tara:strand:- start:517 stop:873 length:357 start_codon:yes stop_codon:yes gene_type:complete
LKKKPYIKEMGYVCSPANFSIKAEYRLMPRNGQQVGGLEISFYDDNNLSLQTSHFMKMTPKNRTEFDEAVKQCLERIFNRDRTSFKNTFLDETRQGIQFYSDLKTVRNKLGIKIFVRK